MASNGFIPHLTLEHRTTHERVDYGDMPALAALEAHFHLTHPEGVPVPRFVYEMTSVHLDGDDWFLRLPRSPEARSVWRHFKGPTVTVLDTARNTETLEPLVLYWEHATGRVWARPLLMFIEHVDHNLPRFFPLPDLGQHI